MYNRHKYNHHYPHPIWQDVKIQLLTPPIPLCPHSHPYNIPHPFPHMHTFKAEIWPLADKTVSSGTCGAYIPILPLFCLKHFLDQRMLEWLSYWLVHCFGLLIPYVGERGGERGKQAGSMDEESQVRGCYNITFYLHTNQETVSVLEKTQTNKTFGIWKQR